MSWYRLFLVVLGLFSVLLVLQVKKGSSPSEEEQLWTTVVTHRHRESIKAMEEPTLSQSPVPIPGDRENDLAYSRTHH